MKRAPAWAALAVTTALAACGGGSSGGSDDRPADQISQTIQDFEDALGDRDLARICDRIFSGEARRRAGGEECPRRLARSLRGVRDPNIEILSIRLGRDAATARVRASEGDERPAIDVVRLVPVEGHYRIDSLSGG